MNKLALLSISTLLFFSCSTNEVKKEELIKSSEQDINNHKIQVLNLGTFHMGYTSDANKTEFDESNKSNAEQIKDICKKLSEFKPTVICVEVQPQYQNEINEEYLHYIKNPNAPTIYANNEVQLLAFEIGRLANTASIVAIDHQLDYNYDLDSLAKEIKADKYFFVKQKLMDNSQVCAIDSTLQSTFLKMNSQAAYDFLININADILAYVNSKNKFEGSDEATKLYQRNLRMYANINNIHLNEQDRVLIISGATHAAFFNEFMQRSPMYQMVNLKEYLK